MGVFIIRFPLLGAYIGALIFGNLHFGLRILYAKYQGGVWYEPASLQA